MLLDGKKLKPNSSVHSLLTAGSIGDTSNNSQVGSEAEEVLSQAFARIGNLEKMIKKLQRMNQDLNARLSRRKRHIREKYDYRKRLAEQETSRSRSRNHNQKKQVLNIDDDEDEDDDLDDEYY